MLPISQSTNRSPQWVQPKASRRYYELRAGDDLLATLEFPNAFGSMAVAESTTGRWTLKRVGFFNVKVTMRREGEQTDLAVYHPRFWGGAGAIELGGEHKYEWKAANFWASKYIVSDSAGKELIVFQQGLEEHHLADLFKLQASVSIEPPAQSLPELDWLVIMGWYIMLLAYEDSAAAAATTATVG